MDFQVEPWRNVEICFKRGNFLLFLKATDEPVQGELAGDELHDQMGMLEDVGYQAHPDLEARRGGPLNAENLGVAGKCCLDPAQNFRSFLTVVTDKGNVPDRDNDHADRNVQDGSPQIPHDASDAGALRCRCQAWVEKNLLSCKEGEVRE